MTCGGWAVLGFIALIFPVGTAIALYAVFTYEPNKWSPYHYACRYCKNVWVQKPGEQPPIKYRPDLIIQGQQALAEEEWRREQAARAAHDYYGWKQLQEQMKKWEKW